MLIIVEWTFFVKEGPFGRMATGTVAKFVPFDVKRYPKPSAYRLARVPAVAPAERAKEDLRLSFLPLRARGRLPDLFPRKAKMRRNFFARIKGIPALRKTRKEHIPSWRRATARVCKQTVPGARIPVRALSFSRFSHAGRFLRRFLPTQKAARIGNRSGCLICTF